MTVAVLTLAWVMADQPPGDAYRLPPLKELTAGRQFNNRYQAQLRERLEWEPYPARRGELLVALAEARLLYEVWDCAEGAHPDWKCESQRKADYLRRLRLAIGRDAYRRMELPPCVPTWRFNELK
jgi:hypothetical protein